MPDEIEVPLEHAHDHIRKAYEEAHGEGEVATEAEKAAMKEHEGWTRFIAVATALLAVIAALGALRSGVLINGALIAKNDEVSNLTRAADQWNYYQAKGIKGVVYTASALTLPPGSPARKQSLAEAARYKHEGEDIQRKAQALEAQAEAKRKEADADFDHHHIFAFSVSLCQIAIALSAVAALTRNRWVWYFGLACGLVGALMLLGGFLGWHLPSQLEF